MEEHVIDVVVEAWHEYEMEYDDENQSVTCSDGIFELQSVNGYESWECSCGASFESGMEAEDHLEAMSGETDE